MRISDWSSDVCSSDLPSDFFGQAYSPGRAVKKSLRAARQREIVRYVQSNHAVSERRSCAVLTFDRRTVRYRSVRADQTPLIMRKIGRAHVELQSLMRISYAVFCLKKKKKQTQKATKT